MPQTDGRDKADADKLAERINCYWLAETGQSVNARVVSTHIGSGDHTPVYGVRSDTLNGLPTAPTGGGNGTA